MRLNLLIQPRASTTEMVGLHNGRIKVRLAAPPVDGAANDALLKFLSKRLGVTLSSLKIASGTAARRKTVLVLGIESAQAASLLGIR